MDLLKTKFFIIGLGIGNPNSLSIASLKILRYVDEVYFEIYTNFTESNLQEYETFLNRKLTPIYRSSLENDSKEFLMSQLNKKTSALVVSGDPFIATTHYMLFVEAVQIGLDVSIYNNVSIYSLVPSILGLSAYKFGKTATIAFQERIISQTPYNVLNENKNINAHTLLFLDIDLEQDKFLSINEAINQLLEAEEELNEKIISLKTKAIALCKVGQSTESKIIYATLKRILEISWNDLGPPQALVFPSNLSGPESESLDKMWSENGHQLNLIAKLTKVVVTGTFDVLHPGHLTFFNKAKSLSIPSELWVVVARNSSVNSFKNRSPILDEKVRLTMLNALEIVDKAILGNEGKDKIKIIEEIKPDFVVLGYDQWINEDKLRQELIKRGLTETKVVRLEKYGSDGYSSSSEIRKKIATTHNKNSEFVSEE